MNVSAPCVLVAVAVGGVAGCSGQRLGGNAVEAGCTTVFEISNKGPEAVDVFLNRGVLIRLGTVPASRSAEVSVPVAGATRVRLVARPVAGGGSVSTDELLLGWRERVRWTIVHPLRYSAITAVTVPAGSGSRGCPPRALEASGE